MLTTIEKESYKGYLAVLAVIYILAIAAYLFLTMLLIKKDVYNPSSSKKVVGGWCITSFVLLGFCFFTLYFGRVSSGEIFCCQKIGS